MGLETITQGKIDELLAMPKRITNSSTREKEKGGHKEKNYKVIGIDDNNVTFKLFVRQNNLLGNDFLCGLLWNTPSGDTLMLTRYNGSSHRHTNHIENQKFAAHCHIHKAQENYLRAGKKADGYAEITERYTTVTGALYCLVSDCNIGGISTTPDETDLFDAR